MPTVPSVRAFLHQDLVLHVGRLEAKGLDYFALFFLDILFRRTEPLALASTHASKILCISASSSVGSLRSIDPK